MKPLESIMRFESMEGIAHVYKFLGDRAYVYGDTEITFLEGACCEMIFNTSMLFDIAQEPAAKAKCA